MALCVFDYSLPVYRQYGWELYIFEFKFGKWLAGGLGEEGKALHPFAALLCVKGGVGYEGLETLEFDVALSTLGIIKKLTLYCLCSSQSFGVAKHSAIFAAAKF